MDDYLTACTGMDALTHAIEAYVSNSNSHLSNVHALEAIRLISSNIEKSIQPDRTLEDMFEMMMGSLQAGLAFSNASLGAVHAMAHSLGGRLDLPHGECNSILLEHVIDLNFDSASELYTEIARHMGVATEHLTPAETKKELLAAITNLRKRLHINDYAITSTINDEILDSLTDGALADPCLVTNPKSLTREEIRGIYARILRQE
jgi:alcohol dehydrogenase class IV